MRPSRGHRRRVFKSLKGRQGLHVPSVRIHRVQRENRHGPMVAAATTNVAVGQIRLERSGRVLGRTLQKSALARGKKQDPPVGQITAVEIVVASARDPSGLAAGQIDFVKMVESRLRQVRLDHLVLNLGHLRIVFRKSHKQPLPVKVEIGPSEVALGKTSAQAAQRSLRQLEIVEHKHPTARPSPPAVVLVGEMGKLGGNTLDEQDRVKVQQRMP